MRFVSRKHGIAVITAALLMAVSTSSMAHAKLQNSVPAADASLKTAPKSIRIAFNEKLEPAFSSIRLRTVQGANIATPKAIVDSADRKVMTLALPALQPQQYQVDWTAVTVDGHRVKSGYKFSIVK